MAACTRSFPWNRAVESVCAPWQAAGACRARKRYGVDPSKTGIRGPGKRCGRARTGRTLTRVGPHSGEGP
ncbi:hypothetical protein LF41_1032 [Lysobacter dokdonensis DS-58]|uniref:Uncharacterized protein n=1 Tax=Lysobacter dokdonensis DS-58 TaxID=1300345 RepID=A0A0A2WQC3_9GAMM|nr:hypothetical protein LF41_1032 [Lysobacter dokdonensis DS-58]